MKKIFFQSIAAFILLFVASFASASTLAELDAILTKAPTLEAFLNDQVLIEEYYNASKDYYGSADKFSRVSYDAILGQMRVVLAKFPDLAQRSWETNTGKNFIVTSNAPTYARNLEHAAWDKYLADYKAELKQQAGDLALIEWPDAKNAVNERLQKVKSLIDAHEAEMNANTGKKADRQAAQGKFFQALKTNPDLQQISSLLILKALNSDSGTEVFDSSNPDLILNYLKGIKDQPKQLLSRFKDIENMDLLASSVKNKLPDVNSLMKDTPIFPQKFIPNKEGKMIAVEAGSAGEWNFVPAPRRFHAFFKGIYFGECVGGSDRKDFLPSLSPERWATIILKETQFHFIEKEGKFQGWVQAVPIQQNGTLFASVDFASYSFRQSIVRKDADGNVSSESMLSAWLREAMKNKPENWKGFVVSQSNAINNGGALPTVRTSGAYLLGERYPEKTLPFAHYDTATVQVLTNIIPRVSYANNYGGSMIFDAAVKDAGDLTMLKETDRSLYDIFRAAIKEGKKDFINDTLNRIHKAAMSDIGNEILTLRASGVLKMLAQEGYRLPNEKVYWNIDPMAYFDNWINAGLSVEEMKSAAAMSCHTVDKIMEFTKKLASSKLATTADEYVRILDFAVKSPGDAYKNAMNDFIAEEMGNIRNRFPDIKLEHLQKLELVTGSIKSARTVLNTAIHMVKTPQEFIDLYKVPYQRGNDAYKNQITSDIFSNLNWFFKQSPTLEQILALSNNTSASWNDAQVKSFADAALANAEVQKASLEYAQKFTNQKVFSRIIAAYAIRHADRFTTPESKKEIINLLRQAAPNVTLENGWKEIVNLEAKLAATPEELVSALTRYPKASGTYATAMAEITKEHWPRLQAMSPTVQQIHTLIGSAKFFQDTLMPMQKFMIEKATYIGEVTAIFTQSASYWNAPEYQAKRLNLLKESSTILTNLQGFPKDSAQINALRDSVPGSRPFFDGLIFNKIQSSLKTAKTPREFKELLTAGLLDPKSDLGKRTAALAKESYLIYRQLNPPPEDLKAYEKAYFSLTERLPIFGAVQKIHGKSCQQVFL